MKTLQDCLSFVRQIEEQTPVNEWTIEGVRIWPLLRTLLNYRLSLSLRGSETAPAGSASSGIAGRLIDAVLAPLRDSGRNLPMAAPAEVFVLTYAGIRQGRIDGRFVDIRTGPLIETLASRNVRSHVWEYAVPPPHRFPRNNPTHLVQRWFYSVQLGNRLLGRRMNAVNLSGYPQFCDTLRSKGALYPELLEKNVRREFGLILALRDRFERAFDIIDPRVAFTSNAGRYEFALNLACHRRNIPTVELQHGVQGPLHGQYAAWSRTPREGYELLPYAYWCWDEASAATINEWAGPCAPRHQAVAGGIPWLEYCLSQSSTVPEAANGRKKGLITLQPPEKIYADGRLLPEFVLEALSKIDKRWVWWVRPHPASPCDTSSLAEEFRRRGIDAEIDRIRDVPLPHLLARTDLHLTHSSSTVLEAEHFQVGSIVWSDLGASLYAPAIASGRCRVALDAEALVREVDRTSKATFERVTSTTPPMEETLMRFLEMGRRMRSESGASQGR